MNHEVTRNSTNQDREIELSNFLSCRFVWFRGLVRAASSTTDTTRTLIDALRSDGGQHAPCAAHVPTALGCDEQIKLCGVQAASADALNNYGWQDQAKKLIRLPITNAMQLTIREYQDPAAARSNLIARADKAFAPPPKVPEKPNVYE